VATRNWTDDDYVASWTRGDGIRELLELPWRMAAALAGLESAPRHVVDVGSGPGGLLAIFLDTYPDARGTWVDVSPAMADQARERLGRFGGRVEFVITDATRLAEAHISADADVVANSRVAHHFSVPGLAEFYRACGDLLVPGGWLMTLDHIRPDQTWNGRYRRMLPLFAGPNAGRPTHEHNYAFPTVSQHLDTMTAAGLSEAELVWKAFYTCLFASRK
jgi:spermidine synthase